MKIIRIALSLIFVVSLFVSCSKDDPKVVITVKDVNDRPVPNVTVTIYSKPGHTIVEDLDYTDLKGKTYHSFVFEGVLDVVAAIPNYSIYHNLRAEGEVTLTKGETFNLELILEEQ